MSENSNFSRRTVIRASAAAIGFAGVGGARAAEGDDEDVDRDALERIPCLDVTDQEDDLETVDAAAVPPEQSSGIGPGSMLFITREDSSGTAGCTANFVWRGSDGTLYLGAAGHCFLPESADADRNAGGSYDSSQVSTRVCISCTFGGGTALSGLEGETVELGDVVYARQSRDGEDIGNDFGLVEIPSDAEHLVDPSMPTWGGPTERGEVNVGETVVQYGNGVGTGETFLTKNRTGVGVQQDPDNGRWYAQLPAAPGDSGSAIQGATTTVTSPEGVEAAGILTHIAFSNDPTGSGTAGTNRAKATQMATEAGLDIETVLVG